MSFTQPRTRGTASAPAAPASSVGALGATADWHDPRYQAFALLRLGFAVAPIAFGLDKFFNVMTDWSQYLAPWINDIVPGNADQAMYAVGVIEIVAGLVVAEIGRAHV